MPTRAYVQSLPKVQLHCHLEGTVRSQTFLALAGKYGIDLGLRLHRPAEQVYAFSDFPEFLLLFKAVCATLREPEDFAQVTRDYVVDAAAQNVRYAELFISPSVWTYFQPGLDVRATVSAIREVLDEEGLRRGICVALIADLTRNFGMEQAMRTAKLAVSLRDLGVIGIGLGGDEAGWPCALFADAFAYARERGLRCVAHAGEAAGAHSVWEALDLLGVERIGHGVRALEDADLVAELALRRIPLEICPTSNRLTGVIPRHGAHPIAALDARGVLCTIDADDPALFRTTLVDEYLYVGQLMGTQALLRMAANAVDASFASQAAKEALHRELAAACATGTVGTEISPPCRTS